jgi:hypothetical protein
MSTLFARRFPLTALALALPWAAGVASGQEPASAPGLGVEERAPEFRLADQNGRKLALSELLSAGPVALVFRRSADW